MKTDFGFKAIVAINHLGYIGNNGKLMWKCKADMRHFKDMTSGGIVIVGAKTFENDLRGKPLPNRETIVVGSQYNTLGQAVDKACAYKHMGQRIVPGKDLNIWVIGGLQIYDQLICLCDEIHLSQISDTQIGDRKFTVPENWRGIIKRYSFTPDVDYVVKNDMICPATQLHCDDECCPVGSICNLKPSGHKISGNLEN